MTVTEAISKDGYLYSTENGQVIGPFSAVEKETSPEYYTTVAGLLKVEPKEILAAHLRNEQELKLKEITLEDLSEILGATIKKDNPTKIVLFLSLLNTFTDEDQQNIAMQADSSTGKSYIVLQIAEFFPDEDKITLASASPTAFFHDRGVIVDQDNKPIDFRQKPSKDANEEEQDLWREKIQGSRLLVDLEKRILILLDMPHYTLMERLRPLLSHDQKELVYKITDKNERLGLRTKTVVLKGFPSMVICSATIGLNDQEKTRVFQLSPDIEDDKLTETLHLAAEKLGDRDAFKKNLANDLRRRWLSSRIRDLKEAHIRDVVIDDPKSISSRFLQEHAHLTPRLQRDFPRLMGLIKSLALLNFQNRVKREDGRIEASSNDIEQGFKTYAEIAQPNEIGLSPSVYQVYEKAVKPILGSYGMTRRQIQQSYFRAFHKAIGDQVLRKSVLPALESAGLILQDEDPQDHRRVLVYPPDTATISTSIPEAEEERKDLDDYRGPP